MEKEKTNDWAQLPRDLIDLITNRLGAIEDFVAFSWVCTSWRSALRQQNWSKRCVPWLLLGKSDYSSNYHEYFLIPSMNKNRDRHNLEESLITNSKHCWGSSIGWIFTQSHDNTTRLINPLTGVQISFPWLSQSIQRALVFVEGTDNNNNNNDNLFVFVITGYHDRHKLAFARPGFKGWVTLKDPENGGLADKAFYINRFLGGFADVACYKDMILGVRADGGLVTCETDNELHPRVSNFAHSPEFVNSDNVGRIYLIESAGDLLMVLVRREIREQKEAFEVYKFDIETRKWAELDDLGDRALFLGDNYSISVSQANGVDCIANCIYTGTRLGLLIFYMKDRQLVVYSYPYFSEEYICSVSTENLASLLNPYFGGVWVMPSLS